MVILFFGDVFGRPGRKSVSTIIEQLCRQYSPDFVLANVENLAGGHGITSATLDELKRLGFHGFSSGNHVWDNREGLPLLDSEPTLLRPANYPNLPGYPCPGHGHAILQAERKQLLFINIMGRSFIEAVNCPFQTIDAILANRPEGVPVLVDFHAETTSEKYAMGWFLNGRVAAVVGTHTHVQTADARILSGGTAYITDVGMCGSFDSVIGLDSSEIITKFITKRKTAYQVAAQNPGVSAVVIVLGPDGRAISIERIYKTVDM